MKFNNAQRKIIFEKFISKWGFERQVIMAMEEQAELIKALSKYIREPSDLNLQNISEEIADVRLMLSQIEHHLKLSKVCPAMENFKLERACKLHFNEMLTIKGK